MVKNKISILYEGLSPNIGGIETYVYNLIKNMDRKKYIPYLLKIKGTRIAFEEEYVDMGVTILECENRRKSYFKYLQDLKDIYKKYNFNYIHINLMNYSPFERITYAKKYSNSQVILHSHNSSSDKSSWNKQSIILDAIGRRKIKKYSLLKVACGQSAGEFMFPNEKFLIFNNGIDIGKFKFNKQNRQEIRTELKLEDNTTVIGIVAKLEVQKNPLFLIEIFKEYQKENKNSKLVLVGEGSLKEQMIEKIKEYNLEDNVILLGKRQDVYKIYSAFDIYLMPSLYEGLSISLVESQVNGLKCYTSDGVDKNSNITGNVEFLSLNNSAKDWAKKILKMNNKRDNKVLKKVPEEFNAIKSYEKVFQFYKDNLK